MNRNAYVTGDPANLTDVNGIAIGGCSTSLILSILAGMIGGGTTAIGTWLLVGVVTVPFTAGVVIIAGGVVVGVLSLAALGFSLAGD
jgi:hypothetical protein